MLVLLLRDIVVLSECGVTANISALGAEDSGFESLHSDKHELLQVCPLYFKRMLKILFANTAE